MRVCRVGHCNGAADAILESPPVRRGDPAMRSGDIIDAHKD
jgi:hypothetical protein